MQNKQSQGLPVVRARTANSVTVADKMCAGSGCRRAGNSKYILYQEVTMKVVLIENPKFISAILRKIYGIKKEKQKLT